VAAIVESKKVWTEAELGALPEDGYLHEVVHGELVMSPKNSFYHGDICCPASNIQSPICSRNGIGEGLDCSRTGGGSGHIV